MDATTLRQLVRFVVVGAVNTAVYYGVYRLVFLALPYLAAHAVAWIVAMAGSFLLNCHFTYRVRPTWAKAALYPLTNLPNAVLTTVGVLVLVELAGIDERVAPLVAAVVAIPITFLVTRWILVPGVTPPEPARRRHPGADVPQRPGTPSPPEPPPGLGSSGASEV